MSPKRYSIGIVPGDGIGPEVVAQAEKVLASVEFPAELHRYDVGGERYLRTGETLPASVLEEWRSLDAVLLGAVGHPEVPPGILEREILLRARFELDLYVNLRPVRLLEGVSSPLAGRGSDDIDFVVVRENTEGLYVGAGGTHRESTERAVALETSVNTYRGARRCCEFAFRLALERGGRRGRPEVCLVHKANVLTHAGRLWKRAFDDAAASFEGVNTWYCHVDAAALYMVTDPRRFDVVVTENLFGDILTDLGAAIAGGMGFASSGNLNPEARFGMFEPVHGSAPDIAGTGRANPIAAILSAAMMLDFLGEAPAARKVESAVTAFLERHPPSPQGTFELPTSEVGDIIASSIA